MRHWQQCDRRSVCELVPYTDGTDRAMHVAALAMWAVLVPAAADMPTSRVFSVLDYGGVGDGTTMNTNAFSRAIAAAHSSWQSSGQQGAVVVPSPGVYLSGQITLLSGVTLSVASGARVLASANVSDYPHGAWAFLYSKGATSIGVTGGGVVDGNFEAYIDGYDEGWVQLQPKGWRECIRFHAR